MGTKLGKLRSYCSKIMRHNGLGGGARIGQVDVTREQKPQDTNLPKDPASAKSIAPSGKDDHAEEAPAWAAPLRDMYQQVVEEPLPDFLADLLSRLDRDSQ